MASGRQLAYLFQSYLTSVTGQQDCPRRTSDVTAVNNEATGLGSTVSSSKSEDNGAASASNGPGWRAELETERKYLVGVIMASRAHLSLSFILQN